MKEVLKSKIKKRVAMHLYILSYEMDAASLFNTWLVSGCDQKVFWLYFSWTR